MPHLDTGGPPAFLRLYFKSGDTGPFLWSSHGIWMPHLAGMVRLRYTYHWYTQPNTTLSFEKYQSIISHIHDKEPTDILGPSSGEVSNYHLIRLEEPLFGWTSKTFVKERIEKSNPDGLRLLLFMGTPALKAMSLKQLDQQLLPALKYPVAFPVRMIVCRSLQMKVHVNEPGEWTGL
jgi:hypothetical protein